MNTLAEFLADIVWVFIIALIVFTFFSSPNCEYHKIIDYMPTRMAFCAVTKERW